VICDLEYFQHFLALIKFLRKWSKKGENIYLFSKELKHPIKWIFKWIRLMDLD
jgi:hypothetical protein